MPSRPWDTHSSSPQWIAFSELKSPGKISQRRCELKPGGAWSAVPQSPRCLGSVCPAGAERPALHSVLAAPGTRGFHIPLALPPALTFLSGHWWGKTGGKEQNLYLSFCPRTVKIVCCGATSSFLTGEGLCFKFYLQTFNSCTFFMTIGFICPHNCLQQFKMSKLGAGVRLVNTKPKACPKEIAVKKTKQKKKRWKALMLCLMLCT